MSGIAKPIPPEVVEYARTNLADSFFQADRGSCWIFPKVPNRAGCVHFKHRGEVYSATRVAVLLSGRHLGPKAFALHHCDNPRCVNPDHIFVGSQKENMHDKVRKGRAGLGGGSKPVLSEKIAREIRTSELPNAVLARTHGVSRGTIYNVRHAKAYYSFLREGGAA